MATSMDCKRWLVLTVYILLFILIFSGFSIADSSDDIVFQAGGSSEQKLKVGAAKPRR